MSSYLKAQTWFHHMPLNAYAGATFFVMVVLASSVFGIFPHGALLVVNAFVSGAAWLTCLGVLVLGGKRVDLWDTATAAFLAAGLTTSIPSLFADDSVVAWGSTFSRIGVLMMAGRWAYNIHCRVHEEKLAEAE